MQRKFPLYACIALLDNKGGLKMRDEIVGCMSEILNKIQEMGLFRTGEKIVLVTKNYILLEHFTGKAYNYRGIEIHNFKTKQLFSRMTPLKEAGYQRAIKKMTAWATGIKGNMLDSYIQASELLAHIFYDILPQYGLILRENQLSLSLIMLKAMEKEKLALCEAEVGTGKTHAYLIAAVVYRLFHLSYQPVIISTSTIALQKALTEEYIPQISQILLEHYMIQEPLTVAIRKGKSHYVCDRRVKIYFSSLIQNAQSEEEGLMEILAALFVGECSIDLDDLPLPNFIKKRICVEQCPYNCKFFSICRYRGFLRRLEQGNIDFQIVNHNLVLADILNRKNGRNHLLPEYNILIFDEAHKLPEAARQMYIIYFDNMELKRLVDSIYQASLHQPEEKEALLLCEKMLQQNMIFFESMQNSVKKMYIEASSLISLKILLNLLKNLSTLFFTTNHHNTKYQRLSIQFEQEQKKMETLLQQDGLIYWIEQIGIHKCRLCALPKRLDFLLYKDLWNQEKTYLLTSATLSVNSDFSHFMSQTGIDLLKEKQLLRVNKASIFDYQNHALLYLPNDMPTPNIRENAYIEAVTDRLEALIWQSYGHTMVLFTSYRMMEIVYQKLFTRITTFPLFSMGKGQLGAIKDFRESKKGVLLASDSAGEGIDLAGDILSSLVIVKLPFPAPDPILEYEKSLYKNFHDYLTEIIVPNMLIKLRQWMGRGIRRITDTCVFSILDSRANGRYREDILATLPDMPVTEQIEDIRKFIRKNKSSSYFSE